MNWADLLEALLLAGFALPLMLRLLGLLPATTSILIQAAALTLSTVWAFLRGDADETVLYACVTILVLLVLRRERRRERDNGTPTAKIVSKS